VEIVAEKRCTKCGKKKPLAEFRKLHGRPGQPCLDCHREINRKWRKSNPEKMQAARDAWDARPENKKRRDEYLHQRYLANREEHNQRSVQWRKDNPEQNLSARRKWYQRNADKQRAVSREYKAAHPEKTKAVVKKWRTEHRDKVREHDHRYRANRANARVSDFTARQWRWLKEQYDNRCAYCGIHSDRLEADHIIPLSRGGLNTIANIVPACKSCNARKKDRLIEEIGMHFAIRIPI